MVRGNDVAFTAFYVELDAESAPPPVRASVNVDLTNLCTITLLFRHFLINTVLNSYVIACLINPLELVVKLIFLQ